MKRTFRLLIFRSCAKVCVRVLHEHEAWSRQRFGGDTWDGVDRISDVSSDFFNVVKGQGIVVWNSIL